ncbi:hypothetical protein PG987_006620 [Apiospora arundinis]
MTPFKESTCTKAPVFSRSVSFQDGVLRVYGFNVQRFNIHGLTVHGLQVHELIGLAGRIDRLAEIAGGEAWPPSRGSLAGALSSSKGVLPTHETRRRVKTRLTICSRWDKVEYVGEPDDEPRCGGCRSPGNRNKGQVVHEGFSRLLEIDDAVCRLAPLAHLLLEQVRGRAADEPAGDTGLDDALGVARQGQKAVRNEDDPVERIPCIGNDEGKQDVRGAKVELRIGSALEQSQSDRDVEWRRVEEWCCSEADLWRREGQQGVKWWIVWPAGRIMRRGILHGLVP